VAGGGGVVHRWRGDSGRGVVAASQDGARRAAGPRLPAARRGAGGAETQSRGINRHRGPDHRSVSGAGAVAGDQPQPGDHPGRVAGGTERISCRRVQLPARRGDAAGRHRLRGPQARPRHSRRLLAAQPEPRLLHRGTDGGPVGGLDGPLPAATQPGAVRLVSGGPGRGGDGPDPPRTPQGSRQGRRAGRNGVSR
jgi:hypothetical protein